MANMTFHMREHPWLTSPTSAVYPWLALGIWLALLILVTYEPSSRFGFSYTDDIMLIKDRQAIFADPHNIGKILILPFGKGGKDDAPYYRPLASLSLMADMQMNGVAPEAYHVTNLVLHGAVTLACAYLLFLLQLPMWATAMGATLFAVHPALTHAIAWIPGRVDIILTLMSMGSVINLIIYLQRRRMPSLVAHLIFLFLAMLSKESAIGLIPIMGAVLWYKHGRKSWACERSLWCGWLVVSTVWIALWMNAAGSAIAATVHSDVPLFRYLLPVLQINLGKIVLPFQQAVLASYSDTSLLPGLMAVIVVGYGSTLIAREDRPLALLCGLMFLVYSILTLPAAQYQILENRMYELMPAFIIFLLLVMKGIVQRLRRGGGILVGVIWLCLTLLYLDRVFDYLPAFADREHFTAQAVASSPHHVIANLNRGSYLADQGRIDEAERYFLVAMKISPDYPYLRNNLGYIKEKQGDLRLAEQLYRDELRANTEYIGTYINLGKLLEKLGRQREAREIVGAGLGIEPRNDALLQIQRRMDGSFP